MGCCGPTRNKRERGSVMLTIIDFIKPNKDCQLCDQHNDYTCFDCEEIQVKNKYPNAILNNEGLWNLGNEVA